MEGGKCMLDDEMEGENQLWKESKGVTSGLWFDFKSGVQWRFIDNITWVKKWGGSEKEPYRYGEAFQAE